MGVATQTLPKHERPSLVYHPHITGSTLVDNTTTGVAASALTSPLWLPWLESASTVAAMVAPILGAVWLTIQIVAKIIELRRKLHDD